MLQMFLKENPSLTSTVGDFGARVREGELHLPPRVMHAVQKIGGPSYKKVSHFVGLVRTFPTPLAKELGWTLDDVSKANTVFVLQFEKELFASLRGSKPDRPEHAGGTLTPPGRDTNAPK